MHRFWIFTLVVGLAGAILPVVTLWAGGFPWLLVLTGSEFFSTFLDPYFWESTFEVFQLTAPYGGSIGVLVGLGAAFWDRLRNSRDDRSGLRAGGRLLGNLFWCSLHTLPFVFLNGVLSYFLLRNLFSKTTPFSDLWLPVVTSVATGVVNIAAVLWATIRTVQTPDILSPRALGRKLRRSTRLQEE